MVFTSLRPLLPYLKRCRWSYAAGAVCVFLTNGIWILFPLVIGRAADDLREGVTRHKLLYYAGLLLAIAASSVSHSLARPQASLKGATVSMERVKRPRTDR